MLYQNKFDVNAEVLKKHFISPLFIREIQGNNSRSNFTFFRAKNNSSSKKVHWPVDSWVVFTFQPYIEISITAVVCLISYAHERIRLARAFFLIKKLPVFCGTLFSFQSIEWFDFNEFWYEFTSTERKIRILYVYLYKSSAPLTKLKKNISIFF